MILAAPAFGVQSTSVPCERWVCKQALGMLGGSGRLGHACLALPRRLPSPSRTAPVSTYKSIHFRSLRIPPGPAYPALSPPFGPPLRPSKGTLSL